MSSCSRKHPERWPPTWPKKLRAAVERAEFNNGDARIPITLSIGLSFFCASDGAEEVFARADAALYRAKAGGRNQVCGEGL